MVKEFPSQCRRHRFDPWVGKIPWRRKWQPIPVFFPGEFHGQRSLASYVVHGIVRTQTRLRDCTTANSPLYSSLSSAVFAIVKGISFKWIFSLLSNLPYQFSSVTQSCLTLCDPMDCSTPGFPVRHQLPEFIQTHIPCVGDAYQLSHPLSSPSSPTFNFSQHQGLSQ